MADPTPSAAGAVSLAFSIRVDAFHSVGPDGEILRGMNHLVIVAEVLPMTLDEHGRIAPTGEPPGPLRLMVSAEGAEALARGMALAAVEIAAHGG